MLRRNFVQASLGRLESEKEKGTLDNKKAEIFSYFGLEGEKSADSWGYFEQVREVGQRKGKKSLKQSCCGFHH